MTSFSALPWPRVIVDLAVALVIGYVGMGLVLSPMDGLMMSVVFGAILVLLGCGAVCDAIRSVLQRP